MFFFFLQDHNCIWHACLRQLDSLVHICQEIKEAMLKNMWNKYVKVSFAVHFSFLFVGITRIALRLRHRGFSYFFLRSRGDWETGNEQEGASEGW